MIDPQYSTLPARLLLSERPRTKIDSLANVPRNATSRLIPVWAIRDFGKSAALYLQGTLVFGGSHYAPFP